MADKLTRSLHWNLVGRSLAEAAWGASVNALGVPRSPFATDEDNSLTVFMTTGADRLESTTRVFPRRAETLCLK